MGQTITVEDAVYKQIDWLTQDMYVCMPEPTTYLVTMAGDIDDESEDDRLLWKDA